MRVGHIQTIKRRGRVPIRYVPSPGGDERHDLCAGAVIVGAEQTTADAAGDAVLLRPGDCRRIVGVGCHIAEGCIAADSRRTGCAIEEGHRLCAGAGSIGAELAVASAAGDAVFDSPCDCLGIIAIRKNIGETAHGLGSRAARRAPQEGDDLRAGAGLIGSEQAVADAARDALFCRPLDRFIEVSVHGNIRENLFRGFFHEAALDRDLARRHGEGVLAVLLGELYLIAVLIQNLKSVQLIALVRLHGDGHGVALGCRLGRNGNGAVHGLIHGNGVAGGVGTAAATAAGGHRIRRKGAGQSFVVGRISRGVGPTVSGVRRNDCVSSHIPRKRAACGSDGADGQRRVCQRLAAGGDLGVGGFTGGRCLADGQRGIFGADVGIILILGRCRCLRSWGGPRCPDWRRYRSWQHRCNSMCRR